MTILESIRSIGLNARLSPSGNVILVGLDTLQHEKASSILAFARENKSAIYQALVKEDGIRCADCSRFKPNQIGDTDHALGSCAADPWDGFKGQWPNKRHLCGCFSRLIH